MKNGLILLLILGIGLFATNVPAYPTNPRSVTVDGPVLQDYFDNKFGTGAIDVSNDQLPYAVFGPGSDTAFDVTIMVENSTTDIFGIYPYGDPGAKLEVIPAGAVADETVNIKFTKSGTQWVVASYQLVLVGGIPSSANIIDYTTFPTTSFGFYLTDSTDFPTWTWYSEDSLNNNEAHALVYVGLPSAGDTGDFYLSWEDSSLTPGSRDYADVVYQVSGDDPVPEAATLFLLGSSLIGLAGIGRQRMKQKIKKKG